MRKLWLCLCLELIKIFRQRGTYVAFGVLAAIVGLTIWGLQRLEASQRLASRLAMSNEMLVGGRLVTAFTVARHIMEPVFLFLGPMLTAMIAGGLVAAERRSGLLRTWLCRPVARATLFTAKALAGALYAVALTFFSGLMAVALGYIVFGGGDLISFDREGLVILEEGLAWQRLALAYSLAALWMITIASLALLASVLFENPLVAAVAAVAVIPVSSVLQQLEAFACLRPYLLTTYGDIWRHAFAAALSFSVFRPALACIGGYCLLTYLLGLLLFHYRDITS